MTAQQQPPAAFLSARQRLGDEIRRAVDRRKGKHDLRSIGNMTGVSVDVIRNWMNGTMTPTGNQWARLKGGLDHSLAQFSQIWQEARVEQDAADSAEREIQRRRLEQSQKPGVERKLVSVGDKLVQVSPLVASPPVEPQATPSRPPVVSLDTRNQPQTIGSSQPPPSEGVETMLAMALEQSDKEAAKSRDVPKVATTVSPAVTRLRELDREMPGWRTSSERAKREAYVEELLSQDGDMSARGVNARVQDKFNGAGVVISVVERVRERLRKRQSVAKRKRDNDRDDVEEKTMKKKEDASEVSDTVRILLEAIPNLATFSLSVDEQGRAKVSYTTREVRVVESNHQIEVRR